MGQTILGGALTSLLAGALLMICQVSVLNKFGVLFVTTIIAAFLTSVVFLPSLLYVFGPDGDCGTLKLNCCSGDIGGDEAHDEN